MSQNNNISSASVSEVTIVAEEKDREDQWDLVSWFEQPESHSWDQI